MTTSQKLTILCLSMAGYFLLWAIGHRLYGVHIRRRGGSERKAKNSFMLSVVFAAISAGFSVLRAVLLLAGV